LHLQIWQHEPIVPRFSNHADKFPVLQREDTPSYLIEGELHRGENGVFWQVDPDGPADFSPHLHGCKR